jgi:hypothetical protein
MAPGQMASGIWCNPCSEFAMEVVMGADLWGTEGQVFTFAGYELFCFFCVLVQNAVRKVC